MNRKLKLVFYTINGDGERLNSNGLPIEILDYLQTGVIQEGKPIGMACELIEERWEREEFKCMENKLVFSLFGYDIFKPTSVTKVRSVTHEPDFINSSCSVLSEGDTFSVLTGKIEALRNLLDKKNLYSKRKLTTEQKDFVHSELDKYYDKLEELLDKRGRFIVVNCFTNEKPKFDSEEAVMQYLTERFPEPSEQFQFREVGPERIYSTKESRGEVQQLYRFKVYENTAYGRFSISAKELFGY